ncbi:HNH endonuclease [Bowmanella yangjiangensis]|uniref:HNH endonuclease n=1 Tax=Bowmanella yangjiangensis TaxID=2811230 RepID=A0ABS3CZC6_9ALTE|nr:HNH endonuclease [Bowmanella yangjiangensis]MBN7822473.1 HNH endonuclease [Bowmanella yangjiangensis]
MRRAEPGDAVLSFSGGLICHVGSVLDFASPAPKPSKFGSAGENWANNGWLLPVEWRALAAPIRPKDRIAELGAMMPKKYSPIHPITGNGNQKAYLAEVGQAAFELLVGPSDSTEIPAVLAQRAAISGLKGIDDAIETQIATDPDLDSTTKQQLILARHGQGLFRARVFELEKACRLTAVETPRLLIASHIKPWRLCSSATERLDGANGLLLAPHVDRLFDRGLISFSDHGEVIVSSRLDRLDIKRLGLQQACEKGCAPFHPRQAVYLAFHRDKVLLL